MKIAIVGSGIAGLTAAMLLSRRHDVTVFEGNAYVGGHTNTIDVDEGDRVLAVDTGFIVFNDLNYPNLCRIFDALGVVARESDMSFSVSCEASGMEYNGHSLDTLLAQRGNALRPRFWGMVRDILRFNREAVEVLAEGFDDTVTVAEYVRRNGYSQQFVTHYLLPLGAALWSCDTGKFAAFPARFAVEFLHNHRMLQVNDRPRWKTVVGGSREYIKVLTAPFRDRIRLSTPVQRVRRAARGVEVQVARSWERFDEVVLAAHADQSLRLVQDTEDQEREVLSMFPYQQNSVVVHTDTSLLPRTRRAWASWNYRLKGAERAAATVTYNMNMLQGLDSEKTYCVSLNQNQEIAADRILRRIRYHHPLFIPGRDRAQAEHDSLVRRRGISYCGAYWGYGFHEDGVRSALAVCEAFGAELVH